MRFTRGRVRELKNGHNSVTVQNRTHVYMNFFDHKGLGNHLLQLCPKVVKHPVYMVSRAECARFRENVPYIKEYQYNPKHLYPKLKGYGNNGERILKV